MIIGNDTLNDTRVWYKRVGVKNVQDAPAD